MYSEIIEEKIKESEQELGFAIPDDYRQFLRTLEESFMAYINRLEEEFMADTGYDIEECRIDNIEDYKAEFLLTERPNPAYWEFVPYIKVSNYKVNPFQIVNLYTLIDSYDQLAKRYADYLSEQAAMMFEYKTDRELCPEDYLPIADNGCGNLICLCINGKNEFKVFYVDGSEELILLADTFKEFLNHCIKK